MIISRLGEYLLILTLFPIIFLLEYYLERKKFLYLFLVLGFIFGVFIIKVLILPQNEYIYKSYFVA